MGIEKLAEFYVYFIEPGIKAFIFLFVVIMLLYVINLARDQKKKADLVTSLFNMMIKLVKGGVVGVGKLVVFLLKASLKIITIIFASVRDFFTSKI